MIISGGKYTEPPAGGDAGVMKRFTDSYFEVGRQYRVIFGGGDAGSLMVQKYERAWFTASGAWELPSSVR